MTSRRGKRSKMAAYIAALALSSISMLVLLWHFPMGTLAAAALVIVAFVIATRIARSLDIESLSDGERRDHGF